jgi:hypothetical protein
VHSASVVGGALSGRWLNLRISRVVQWALELGDYDRFVGLSESERDVAVMRWQVARLHDIGGM